MARKSAVACVLAVMTAAVSAAGPLASARSMYEAAVARERALRTAWDEEARRPGSVEGRAGESPKDARAIVAAYERIVWRYPTSGYCDNALWQAARLASDLFARVQQPADRRTAVRLFQFLAREYPTSSLAGKAADQARRLQSTAPADAPDPAKSAEASSRGREAPPNVAPARRPGTDPASSAMRAAPPPVPSEPIGRAAEYPATAPADAAAPAPVSMLREVRRTVFPEVVRVSLELDREVIFHERRVENPARLLFDLSATKPTRALKNANRSYQDDIVRHIRIGAQPKQTTRVVLDLDGVSRYTIVTLYNPYRILIDCERAATGRRMATGAVDAAPLGVPMQPPSPAVTRNAAAAAADVPGRASRAAGADGPAASPGTPPAAGGEATRKPETDASETPRKKAAAAAPEREPGEGNRVSMARQLGLGISRIVIDPGHGGRDPGAEGSEINEAAIVLDIALRLEKALKRQSGIEVVLTRRTDVFVPLEQRTEIANREQADLFLSIHANASRNPGAHGIESYYLNFATNPDAEAVAARENAASERTMNNLTDIVKAIALNNKLDESKDFAALVQQAMARRLKASNKSLKNLGVKQAPFVVLIGAAMPSVLAEVSFLTNHREGELLATEAYRQRIADALADAILRYKRTLKTVNVVAHE